MKVCVIGLGSMGKRRIRILKRLYPDMGIIGIDSNMKRAQEVQGQYGIRIFSSLKQIDVALDCVFICTSPQSHGEIIHECLEKGWHIFSEINLVNNLYEENICLSEEKQKILFLSSTPMYRDEMQYIGREVKQNGRNCFYQYHVGQYLPDWHPWDNLKDFFVSNKNTNGCRELLAIELPWIQYVFGKIKKVNVIKRKMTNLGLDFPDVYLIQMEHEGGNVGSLVVDVVSRQAVRNLEVLNEDLYIRWSGTPDSLYKKDTASGELKQVLEGKYVHEQGYAEFINEYAYEKEVQEFFEVIQGKQPIYDFEADIETLKIIDEIER